MNFENNLVELRKKHDLSQVQLGKKINVSRQTISKWEAGTNYPEMDKLVLLSEFFNISIDDLILSDAKKVKVISNNQKEIKESTNSYYNFFSLGIALAISLLILGIGIASFLAYKTTLASSALLLFVIISIIILIYVGIKYEELDDLEPINYPKKEKDDYESKRLVANKVALLWLILGIVIVIILKLVKVNNLLIIGYLLICTAIAAFIYLYYFLQGLKFKEKRNVIKDPKRNKVISDKATSSIMIASALVFLTAGFVFNLWHPGWFAIMFGALLSLIVSIILE